MNKLKRIFAVLGLCSMAVFVAAVVVLLVIGKLETEKAWVYGPITLFLFFGLGALVIDYFQKRQAEKEESKPEN